MGVYERVADSKEMKRNKRLADKMSGVMGFDENLDKVNKKRMRRIYEFAFAFLPREKGVSYEKACYGGVSCQDTIPKECRDNHILLYFHGGGFVAGSGNATKGYTSMMAAFSRRRVIAPEYRRAPENPFPAGVDDCFSVYKEILSQYPDSEIVLLGDSAGGNLSLVTALRAIKEGLKKPACLILHSPVVDFSGSVKRTEHEIQDSIVKIGCNKPLHQIYVGKADPGNPYVSPILGEFQDFSPLYITCDYHETLNGDAHALYQKATQNHVEAVLVEMKNGYHAFGALAMSAPETRQICRETVEFMDRMLSK